MIMDENIAFEVKGNENGKPNRIQVLFIFLVINSPTSCIYYFKSNASHGNWNCIRIADADAKPRRYFNFKSYPASLFFLSLIHRNALEESQQNIYFDFSLSLQFLLFSPCIRVSLVYFPHFNFCECFRSWETEEQGGRVKVTLLR